MERKFRSFAFIVLVVIFYNLSLLGTLQRRLFLGGVQLPEWTVHDIPLCQRGYIYIHDSQNIHNQPKPPNRLVPEVLYQTSKSRCMHPDIALHMNKWRDPHDFPGYSYRFYDDAAMDAFLFDKERWEETFPSLHLALQCIDKVHNPTMKADIWRYLILWECGGMYADIDTSPSNFTALSIRPEDDGLFYVENEGGYVAQYFLAVSPRHPLMFYSVHAAIQNLLFSAKISRLNIEKVTGYQAVADAMTVFTNNATSGRGIENGKHVGESGRSIRVGGLSHYHVMENGLGYTLEKKNDLYAEMKMTHYLRLTRDKAFSSCYITMNATKTPKGFEHEGVRVELLEIPLKPPHVYFEDIDRRNKSVDISSQLIPKVIYQTSKSRYIHPEVAQIMNKWRNPNLFPGFSHFLYDDEAMDAFLFDKERWEGTFPSLHLVLQCVDRVNNPTMRADLWRYLILWEYGGIYADIDADPINFSAKHIRSNDDGLFYLDTRTRFIEQFFLAVSPRHPLMLYTVHAAIQNLLAATQFSQQKLAKVTGPRAVQYAMTVFMNDTTAGANIKRGRHVGTGGRSIRVGGLADSYVIGDGTGYLPKKKRIWTEMNMTHYVNLGIRKNFGSCYNMMNATETAKGFEYEGVKVDLLEIPLKIKKKLG